MALDPPPTHASTASGKRPVKELALELLDQ